MYGCWCVCARAVPSDHICLLSRWACMNKTKGRSRKRAHARARTHTHTHTRTHTRTHTHTHDLLTVGPKPFWLKQSSIGCNFCTVLDRCKQVQETSHSSTIIEPEETLAANRLMLTVLRWGAEIPSRLLRLPQKSRRGPLGVDRNPVEAPQVSTRIPSRPPRLRQDFR